MPVLEKKKGLNWMVSASILRNYESKTNETQSKQNKKAILYVRVEINEIKNKYSRENIWNQKLILSEDQQNW